VRYFIYEFVTGGGWYAVGKEPPPESLRAEGRAMLEALAVDFAALPGAQVDVLCDARQKPLDTPGVTTHLVAKEDQERRQLRSLAREADWTLLIAPEFSEHLLTRTRDAIAAGGRLLGPRPQLVALASDKHATAVYLARHGLRVPQGIALAPGEALPEDFPYPAVLKPRDGCGSLDVELVEHAGGRANGHTAARLERHCPGEAASVACFCGPGGILPLVPCRQLLGGESGFFYQGGSLPLPPALAARARRLALSAVAALPEPAGYLGVDLILGSDPAGSGDVVVEINPRPTTSYVGLRALAHTNLAAALVAIASGVEVELCWKEREIQFTSSGILTSGR
jgi:predicted ATP-grasp superfamily ATP-dependent carboligase